MDLAHMIVMARGEKQVDLVIKNCQLVNVLSGDVSQAEVAVSGGTVVGIDKGYSGAIIVDLGGRYLAPGLIDAHVHIESSMLTVPQFAAAVVPRGTTLVVTDCHEIANVLGVAGIRFMVDSAKESPLDILVMLPSCVPATPLETSGAVLSAGDLEPLLDEPWAIGMGELMNFPGTIAGAPDVLAKLELFKGMPVDGHAPGLGGLDLAAYIAAGVGSDHECTSAAEAAEKLAKGMYVFMREGTGARNLLDLLEAMNPSNSRRCCLCVDDRHPGDLLSRGHIDSMLRMVVETGIPPVTALQMATINTAERFGLAEYGAIAPGFVADMVAFDDLESFEAMLVFKAGQIVAKQGRVIRDLGVSPEVGSSFNVAGFSAERLVMLASDGARARVIGIVQDQIVTEALSAEVPVRDGAAVSDPASDTLKMAVVERHAGTGNVGLAFVRGFGLKSGALASSIAHDSHNIVVVGCTDADMAAAVARVTAMGGGQVVVAGGKVAAENPLPIGGLMSSLPADAVASQVDGLNKAAAELGCSLEDPFMTMSFLALPVIPELKLTDRGLVDVGRFEIIGAFDD